MPTYPSAMHCLKENIKNTQQSKKILNQAPSSSVWSLLTSLSARLMVSIFSF